MALHFDRSEYKARIAKVRRALEAEELEGLLKFSAGKPSKRAREDDG